MIRVLLTISSAVNTHDQGSTGVMTTNVVEFADKNDLLVAYEHFAMAGFNFIYHVLAESEPEMAAELPVPLAATLIKAGTLMREATLQWRVGTKISLTDELRKMADQLDEAAGVLKTYG